MDKETNNCHILAADTDDFFRDLLTRLHESGNLEDTVIIAFTDHNAYGFSDTEKIKQYSQEAGGKHVHRVPAFIFNYGTEP
ncbi:sulfatase-like hydrolase/transferase, partial [Salmonella enterica]